MNIERYKSDYLDKRMQLVLFEKVSGNIIYSNETLVKVLKYDSAYQVNPFIESIGPGLVEMSEGQKLMFPCVNVVDDGNQLYHDYQFDVPAKEQELVVWQMFDFTDHYENLIHVQQERNDVEILQEYRALEQEKMRLENELLEYKNNELKRQEKLKTDFFAQVSHELRNPVNGIIGLAKLVKKTKGSLEREGFIDTLDSLAQHLVAIVNNVLDLSKIESGELSVEKVVFNLHETLRSLPHVFHFQAAGKGLDLQLEIGEDVPGYVIGDGHKLSQVLYNLVGNAVKFTEKGQVRLEVYTLPNTYEGVHIAFKVIDTGIGIREEQLEEVFLPYKQAEASTTRRYGGTGLGLPIVKQLVEQMEGEIFVESELGRGSTFRFWLPFLIEYEEPVPKKQAAHDQPSLNIIVGEDDPINRVIIEHTLALDRHSVTLFANGEELAQYAMEHPFDVMVLDFNLPGMKGNEVLEYLRGKGVDYKPVLILSGEHKDKLDEELATYDICKFVHKPVDPAQLLEHIYACVGIQETAVDRDLDHLRALFDDDKERLQKLVDLFIEEMPVRIDQMLASFREESWGEIRELAHRMKSGYGYFRMKAMSGLLSSIEKEIDKKGRLKDKGSILKLKRETEIIVSELKKIKL